MKFMVCSLLLVASAFPASPQALFFYREDGGMTGVPTPDHASAAGALNALRAPPPGLNSAIPADAAILGFQSKGEETVIDFAPEILNGLGDTKLESIVRQVRETLRSYGIEGAVRMRCGGLPLSSYLPPTPEIAPRNDQPQIQSSPSMAPGTALAGRSISLSPGHGKRWGGSSYTFERPVYCSPLSCEDDHNNEIMVYLNQYLTQDGAVTKVYRNLNKNYGTHTSSGEPWWRVSAGYWLKQIGYPCTVYSSLSGDCTLGTGGSESDDSLRSRPLASDYDNTDIYVSLHSNGLSGNCYGSTCPNGTCTYYDKGTEHAAWGIVSSNLARYVNNSLINSIRNQYSDSTWQNRGIINADGDFAETRIPNRAAILIELAFHDSCDRDALYLQDNFFRSTTMWAAYKGICDYFGVTPGWDYYSYEIVSDNMPATMTPGSSTVVQITLRNRGVLWNDAKQFRLGAVNDSDPFTATTRFNVGAEISPGQTKVFSFTLTAPTTLGTYTTDWRMVREGVTWFGPTLTRNILVSTNGDNEAPTAPTSLVATAPAYNQVNLSWRAATDNLGISHYRIYRNSAFLGTSSTTNYSDAYCASMTTYQYQVSAMDFSTNESSRASVTVTTPPQTEFVIDNPQGAATGSWQTGTASSDKYATDYRFSSTVSSQTASFRWTPDIEKPGFYNLYAWYPEGSNRCTNSPYTINFAGGSAIRYVNQTSSGGGWVSLGSTRPFITGTSGWIQLGNQSAEPSKVVLADAVRFVWSSALPAIPNIQAQKSGTNVVLSWSNAYCLLQESASLSNPAWQDIPGATSPFTVSMAAAQRKFYRLRY